MGMPELRTAAYFTLGCKLNFAETSTIGKILASRGITRCQRGGTPDICVVNTCSVTQMADKKGRSLIRRITARYPAATVVVTGCYAQLKPEEVASIPGVDIVLGSDEKLRIEEFLDRWLKERCLTTAVTPMKDIRTFRHSCERGDRTRWFLKVQDGCDYFCTYCTIPFARGRSRSPRISELVDQAQRVAAAGGREIVLTGVNIGDFGKGGDETFFQLIRALDQVEGISRFRISSIEPNLLTPEIIRWVARESRAFMPHFHIPLQSGSDEVLRLMHRRYDTGLFEDRVRLIRSEIPDAFIGVDVIAGARGETPERWQEALRFIENLPVTRLHVFPYSERPGTVALTLDGEVPVHERHQRVATLTDISERKLRTFMQNAVGTDQEVLWEAPVRPGAPVHGFTRNYLRVVAPVGKEVVNTISNVRVTGLHPSESETLSAVPS